MRAEMILWIVDGRIGHVLVYSFTSLNLPSRKGGRWERGQGSIGIVSGFAVTRKCPEDERANKSLCLWCSSALPIGLN